MLEQTLLYWAARGIYIEWLADCFELNRERANPQKVCWRPVINWYEEGEWVSDDVGCHNDLYTMIDMVNDIAKGIYKEVYKNRPLILNN